MHIKLKLLIFQLISKGHYLQLVHKKFYINFFFIYFLKGTIIRIFELPSGKKLHTL